MVTRFINQEVADLPRGVISSANRVTENPHKYARNRLIIELNLELIKIGLHMKSKQNWLKTKACSAVTQPS